MLGVTFETSGEELLKYIYSLCRKRPLRPLLCTVLLSILTHIAGTKQSKSPWDSVAKVNGGVLAELLADDHGDRAPLARIEESGYITFHTDEFGQTMLHN